MQEFTLILQFVKPAFSMKWLAVSMPQLNLTATFSFWKAVFHWFQSTAKIFITYVQVN